MDEFDWQKTNMLSQFIHKKENFFGEKVRKVQPGWKALLRHYCYITWQTEESQNSERKKNERKLFLVMMWKSLEGEKPPAIVAGKSTSLDKIKMKAEKRKKNIDYYFQQHFVL